MSIYILSLPDPAASLENVGGKGMSLAKLTRAGLPVPDGFHITTDAYRRFVDANKLQPRILSALKKADPAQPSTLESVSQVIQRLFMDGSLPAELAAAVMAAYGDLCARRSSPAGRKAGPGAQMAVAVRSSATAEDLPEASFAGQQDTFLNIHGGQALLQAVCRCWASLWTGRAIAYRARQGIDPDQVALAVVVQELVFADAAGVMFTANPVNGKRDEMMVTAAWGLGEAIVSGAVTPDTLTISKSTSRLIQCDIAEKKVMTIRTETGTREAPVPQRLWKKAVLSKQQASGLGKLGIQIDDLYAMPMDIEWTLTAGRFAIVQARPITALPEPPWNGRCRVQRSSWPAAALPSSCRSRSRRSLPPWLYPLPIAPALA